ncbi:unnamed protein product [marine sediment metagenome]|uniref:Asparagine synthetase domain-containing protein n=1 Tax=marine sediment metagenome TaxID=412755 RepID=X1K754_9ZZZZ
MEISYNSMMLADGNKLEFLRDQKIVVTWTGGLDSTSLIALLLLEYNCTVLPLFVARGQKNYEEERASIEHFSKKFSRKFKSFHDTFEVNVPVPAKAFKEKYGKNQLILVLRNSDLINQAIRYAVCENVAYIAVGSNIEDTFG